MNKFPKTVKHPLCAALPEAGGGRDHARCKALRRLARNDPDRRNGECRWGFGGAAQPERADVDRGNGSDLRRHEEFPHSGTAWGEVRWRSALVIPPEKFAQGSIQVPRRPGFGIQLNDKLLRAQQL